MCDDARPAVNKYADRYPAAQIGLIWFARHVTLLQVCWNKWVQDFIESEGLVDHNRNCLLDLCCMQNMHYFVMQGLHKCTVAEDKLTVNLWALLTTLRSVAVQRASANSIPALIQS